MRPSRGRSRSSQRKLQLLLQAQRKLGSAVESFFDCKGHVQRYWEEVQVATATVFTHLPLLTSKVLALWEKTQ